MKKADPYSVACPDCSAAIGDRCFGIRVERMKGTHWMRRDAARDAMKGTKR